MAFEYEMVGDASKAIQASDQVVASLVGVEAKAKAASASITNAFGDKARDALGRLNASALSVERAFAGIAVAMQHELTVLDRLNRGNRELEQDLIAIESLWRQGKVSAAQYAAELERIARAAPDAVPKTSGTGNASQAMEMIGFGNAPKQQSALGGVLMQGAGMAMGMAGIGGAADIIMTAANAWIEYEHAQTEAYNTLVKFFPTAERTNQVLEAQNLAASHLSIDVREMAGTFADVKEASDGAYLSTLQQIDVTRTLGEVMQIQGKPVKAAGDVMKQLQLAMETGTVTGMQFKTMLRENDDVVEVLTDKTGKSAKELLEMAKAGKFNREMIATWFEALADGESVHEKWNKRQKVGADLMFELIPVMGEARDEMEAMNRAALESADAWERFGLKFQKMHDDLERQINKRNTVTALLGLANTNIMVGAATASSATHNQLMDLITKRDEKEKLIMAANAELAAGTIDKLTHSLIMNELQSKNVDKATKSLIDQFDRLRAQLATPTPNIALFKGVQDDLEALRAEFDSITGVQTFTGEDLSRSIQGSGLIKSASIEETMKTAVDAGKAMADEWAKAVEEMQKAEERAGSMGQVMIEQVQQLATSIGSQLVAAANGADVSWKSFFKGLLQKLEEAIAQAIILNMLTGSVTGAAGAGGAYGGLFGLLGIKGGNHAMGGSYTARGSGGTDSIPVLFMMSPNERADFTPAGMPRGGYGADTPPMMGGYMMGAPPAITVVNKMEDGQSLLSHVDGTPGGDRAFYNYIRRNSSTVNALLEN